MGIEATPAGQGESVARQGVQRSTWPFGEKVGMYKLAYDESVRTLVEQVDQLSNVRQRLVAYLAFIGSATAFLVGAGLKPQVGSPGDRHALFYWLAVPGTLMMALTIVCTLVLLWPSKFPLTSTADAEAIIDRNIERDVPVQSEGELYRDLAFYNAKAARENDTTLEKVLKWYVSAIVLGAAQLLTWIALVWIIA